jgi:hypothetical protein
MFFCLYESCPLPSTGSGDRTLLNIQLAQVDAAYNLIQIIYLLSRLSTPQQAITDVKSPSDQPSQQSLIKSKL